MRLLLIILFSLQIMPFFPPTTDTAESVVDAPYSTRFAEIGFNRPLTLFFYDVTNETLLAGINIDQQMPVVSSIKGAILLYFFAHVSPDVWDSVPVEYWHSEAQDVPPEYTSAWQEHQSILRDCYRMIVYSDNVSTGNVMMYAHNTLDTERNPMEAFNEWAETVIGIAPESGMREWDQGATANPNYIDRRFDLRTTPIRGVPRFFNNMFSALDMARFYHWLYTQADERLFAQAQALMSIVEGYPGFLETTAIRLDGISISKDGFVGPEDEGNTQNDYLTADGGLIIVDDHAYIIITMGVNGGDRLEAIYNQVEIIIRSQQDQIFWVRDLDYLSWMRSPYSPYGENNLSNEALYFILEYMIDIEQRPLQGQAFTGDVARFEEARNVWLTIFPDDIVPNTRTPEQNRFLAARYGYTSENLYEIALELGLVDD